MIHRIAAGYTDRGKEPFARAALTDFVALCTDASQDLWALYPAAELDERGKVVSVRTERGAVESAELIREVLTQMLVKSSVIADRKAVRALCWRPHSGLIALRDAILPHTKRAGPPTGPEGGGLGNSGTNQ